VCAQILNKKGMGVRARCIKGLGKINPFTAMHDWVGILNHVAMTMYVPSYMSWNDEFQVRVCIILVVLTTVVSYCSLK
jgi:hypothetical protein